ncbi:MAG: HNH endonuclease [bacterium]
MKAYVAVTDRDWFRFLRARSDLDEINFWQPRGTRAFTALNPGEPFLFKLHYPTNYIVGGGFFAHSSILPSTLAWDAFGEKNGAATLDEMRGQIEKYRRMVSQPFEDYKIGCIILEQPFFLEERDWIPTPDDFARNIVRGKRYNLQAGTGRELWNRVQAVLTARRGEALYIGEGDRPVYGEPVLVRPRLGQGSFRVLITDVYQRRCAVTREKALPVLQAAHIKPLPKSGTHEIGNGLLLRSDVHTLLDRGYVTVTPDFKFLVSRRLKTDFDNGEHYYQLNGQNIWVPPSLQERPNRQYLEWHADSVFLR